MSFECLLDHTCDIYHIVKAEKSPGFNLPPSPSFSYDKTPDICEQKCHFGVHSMSSAVVQNEPQNILEARIKLYLPIDTDIRINDKIVECSTGLEFTAELPRHIRNHHISVYIKRIERQKPL